MRQQQPLAHPPTSLPILTTHSQLCPHLTHTEMHSKRKVDFDHRFLVMLGKRLSLRDRERLRRVCSRWNAAFMDLPPTVLLPVKCVTVQDEMIAVETGRISSRYYFRNDKMLFFNVGQSSVHIERVFSRAAFEQFAGLVMSIPVLRVNVSLCSSAPTLLRLFRETCSHWVHPRVIARCWCASLHVFALLALLADDIVILNLHRNSARRCVRRSCEHARLYRQQAEQFSALVSTMTSLQVLSAPVQLLSGRIDGQYRAVLDELHRIDAVIIDHPTQPDWLPDSLREYVLHYNVRFCVDSAVIRVVSFEQMKQFAERFGRRMQQLLSAQPVPRLPRCRVLLHLLGKELDISYLANHRLRGWDLLVRVTQRF